MKTSITASTGKGRTDPTIRTRAHTPTPVSPLPPAMPNNLPRLGQSRRVPIDIFVFEDVEATVPLVNEALDWEHGVFLGATAASETTAAVLDVKSNIRRPFAMLPFCGYNMGDYWQHWFEMGEKLGDKAPKIFFVNWFRKSPDGDFLWPGFGENSRVLKWMCERVDGTARTHETPIGKLPLKGDLDLSGLDASEDLLDELSKLIRSPEAGDRRYRTVSLQFGDRLPERMKAQRTGCGTSGLKESSSQQFPSRILPVLLHLFQDSWFGNASEMGHMS